MDLLRLWQRRVACVAVQQDFLQFFGERDLQGNFARRLHSEEKLSGHYPAGFPDLIVPGSAPARLRVSIGRRSGVAISGAARTRISLVLRSGATWESTAQGTARMP